MVPSMLRAQRRDPAKAQAKCAFATNYPLANRQLRSPLILRYRMQRDKTLCINLEPPSSFVDAGDVCLNATSIDDRRRGALGIALLKDVPKLAVEKHWRTKW